MLIQLKTKTGMFYDPETKLRLRGDEIKEVKHVGYQTRLRMNSGGIAMVDKPEDVKLPVVAEPVIVEPIIEPVIIEDTPVVTEEIKEPKPKAKKKPGAKKKTKTFSLE